MKVTTLLFDPQPPTAPTGGGGGSPGAGMSALSNTPPVSPAPAPTPSPTPAPTTQTPPSPSPAAEHTITPPAGPAAPATMTPEQIAQLTANVVKQVLPHQGQQPQAAQPTPEDLERIFNVHKFTQDDVTALLGGGEGALQVFHRMRDGVVK